MAEEESSNTEKHPKKETLLLYHSLWSSCSQKVLLALYEKDLDFESCLIDLYNGENFEPFMLNLNPKGEVPVLTHGTNVIADSSRILEYLDENFNVGKARRLIPDEGTAESEKVKDMRKLLERISLPIITFGTLFQPQIAVDSKMSMAERKSRINGLKFRTQMLDMYIEKHPEYETVYRAKQKQVAKLLKAVQDGDGFRQTLKELMQTLDKIEEELIQSNGWLCGPHFTVADILLTVLLHRLDHLGISEKFFNDRVHPSVAKYFERVKKRESFEMTFYNPEEDSSNSILPYVPVIIVLGTIVFAVVAALAYVKSH